MRARSALWKALAASGSARMEAKAVINGTEYPEILSLVVNRAMSPDALSVGNCVSATLQLAIRPVSGIVIPDKAEVTVKVRFTDGERASEWMTVGTFYANRRTTDAVTGTVAFQGFDIMRKADASFPNLSGFPKAMNSAVMEISRNIGVEVDARTWENVPTGSAYYVPLPADGEKMIKILGYIGGVCGGNWIITPQNKLRLVPLMSASGAATAADPASIVGITGRISTGNAVTVTGISASSGSKTYFAGSETGAVVHVSANPYVTQATVNALLSKYSGLSYVPYSIEKGLYDPALEIGDFLISRSDIQSVVCQETAYYSPAFRGNLSAPFVLESDGEGQSLSEAIAQSGDTAGDLSVRIYKFTSQSAATVGDGQSAEIINFDFAAGAGQDVVFHAEIKHTTETTETGNASTGWTCTDAVLTVTYYINGTEVEAYHPTKSEMDGANLLHLTYHFANGQYNAGNFRVTLSLSGGSVAIAAGDARAYIIGQGYSGSDTNWVTEDGLVFIGVESYPDKMNYTTGETLDLTGLVVKAYYADGTEEDITADCAVTPADGAELEPGENAVEVSYTADGAEFADSFSVYCEANNVLFIEVTTPPTTTEYFPGEALDLTGVAVTATYEDGSETDVTSECVFTPANGTTLIGDETITVNAAYTENDETFAAYFDVNVKRIRIMSYPLKPDYFVGEVLDYAGLEVVEALSDGTTEDVTADCTLLPAEGTTVSEPGDIMVDVRCNGKSLGTFWVAVIDAQIIAQGGWWRLYDNGLLSVYCDGAIPNYTDSDRPPWYPYRAQITSATISNRVTSIGDRALANCTNLASVTISHSVTTIGKWAFYNCSNLQGVAIPDSVTVIDRSAFNGCASLTSVTIPDSVTTISDYAFVSCANLQSVHIPDSVTQINTYAFSGCSSLVSVTIPDSVTLISTGVFLNCTNLESVAIPDSVTQINMYAFKDCTHLASVTIPHSVTIIGEQAFTFCEGLASVTIEDGVTSIYANAFFGCTSLTNVTIPASVTVIGVQAFKNCTSLASVAMDNSVTRILRSAFQGCTSLASVMLGSSVTTIGETAFDGCASLASAAIPDSVTTIGIGAFRGCTSLTSVTIPDGVTTIGGNAFDSCTSLTSVIIPDSVTTISGGIFWSCTSLESVAMGDSVTSIEYGAFAYCESLANVTIPDSVTEIGEFAFYGCTNLTSVTIPDSMTTIAGSVFSKCANLTSVTIPDGVTAIGNYAFALCTSLSHVYYSGTRAQWNAVSVGTNNEPLLNATIHCADVDILDRGTCGDNLTWTFDNSGTLTIFGTGSMADYSSGSATPWADFRTSVATVTIERGVTSAGNRAFDGCTSLTSVTIPDSVTSINTYAFKDCTSLTGVTIPDGVASIGKGAFARCSGLTSVTIGDSVTTIDEQSFALCTNLASVTIPDSVTSIGLQAFRECTSLTSATLGSSVTTIGGQAFFGCTSLAGVTIPNSVTSIGEYAFHGCTSLTSVIIPDSVTTIGKSAFRECANLVSAMIGNGVTSIGDWAFENCTNLASVSIPDSVTSIGEGAFDDCASLANVIIPDSVTVIGEQTFCGCTSLTSVTIPDGVTAVEVAAFYRCANLSSVTIPDSVVSISDYAFNSTALSSVTINRNATVGSNAFPVNCVVNYYD